MTRTLGVLLAGTLLLGGPTACDVGEDETVEPVVLGTPGLAPGAGAGPRFDVQARDFDFDPPDVRLSVGSTVVWTNTSSTAHTVTSGPADCAVTGAAFDQLLEPGSTFELPFVTPGTYPYFSRLPAAPAMEGTITVTDTGGGVREH